VSKYVFIVASKAVDESAPGVKPSTNSKIYAHFSAKHPYPSTKRTTLPVVVFEVVVVVVGGGGISSKIVEMSAEVTVLPQFAWHIIPVTGIVKRMRWGDWGKEEGGGSGLASIMEKCCKGFFADLF